MSTKAFPKAVSLMLAALLLIAAVMPTMAAQPTNTVGPGLATVIYTNIAGEPTADVPGLPGVHFGPGTGTTHFDRVYGSPNGNWILSADTDLPTGADEIILVNNVVKAIEGDPAAWTGGAENIGFIDTELGINDAGWWTFATNTNGATTSDEYILLVSPTDVFTYTAREGDPAPQLPGATWGSTLDSSVILDNNAVGFSGDNLGGPPTTENDVLVLGSTLLAQEGVTVPPGQLGTEFWENFDLYDFWASSDGTHWMAQGDLTGSTATDDVAVVDGTVVVQEGVILPGTTFTNPVDASGIVGVHMAPGGDWFVRGNNDLDEQDWVYSNGSLLTTLGMPIVTGGTEVWDDADFSDCFFIHIGDSYGNFVIGGVTDAPSTNNGVLVLNNTDVIIREGDPVDLDNNGLPDDNAYFDTFGNDDAYLSDAGIFYVVATVKDDTDTRLGQGFFSLDVSSLLNTPPTLSNVAATSPINENDATTLTGDINDPDAGNSFSLVVDWGDMTVMTYTYGVGTTSFTETHQYLDDDPTGTPSDIYAVSLIISDDAGGSSMDSTNVTVNNVAPSVDAGTSMTLTLGAPMNFSGSFTDPGTLDTHTITWDFGDGTGTSGTLNPSHTYTMTGVYSATLTVVDDDTGTGANMVLVTVQAPTAVSLSAFGGHSQGANLALVAGMVTLMMAVALALVVKRRYLQS